MQRYTYDGPVMRFDNCLEARWTATTVAPNAARARSNLTYRYKMENGYDAGSRITLPGKLILE
jgi:hypothetical protein